MAKDHEVGRKCDVLLALRAFFVVFVVWGRFEGVVGAGGGQVFDFTQADTTQHKTQQQNNEPEAVGVERVGVAVPLAARADDVGDNERAL